MIAHNQILLMKKNAIIINVSKGVVNENDLNNALDRNIISFAGLDVLKKSHQTLIIHCSKIKEYY